MSHMSQMAGKSITVNLAVGTTAALLTALEYVLSTVSALSIRAAIHGFWLIGLHRGGKAQLDRNQRLKRSFRKDVMGACMGVWLVLGVALVESNLNSGVRISADRVNSTECVSMYGRYEPTRLNEATPPYRTTVEPWVLKVAEILDCGERGIATVGVGGATDSYGVKQNMSAPVCGTAALDVGNEEIHVSLTSTKLKGFFFEPNLRESESFILFPHNCSRLGKDISHIHSTDGTGSCGERGISNFFISTSPSLQTTFVHALNMSLALHESICSLHGKRPVVTLPDEIVESCVDREKESLSGECLRSKASSELVHAVTMADMGALFVGKGVRAQSFACPSATIEQEYVFINPRFVTELEDSARANLTVLVVTSARVTKGYCEPTVAVLGQAALLYTADSDWRNDQLSLLDKRTLYHAYMIAVSSSQFPLNTINGRESPTTNGSCFVRPVSEVTEIALDWRLFILVSGLISALVMITLGMTFRMIYTGESWSVGSAQWSLSRLLNEGQDKSEEKEALIEVVAVSPVEEGGSTKGKSWRQPAKGSSTTNTHRGKSHSSSGENSSPRKPMDVQYQYIVRTAKNSNESREHDGGQGEYEDFADCQAPSRLTK